MTKEKVKEILDYIRVFEEIVAYDDEEVEEACSTAIKALEQEPRKGHWIMLGTKEEIYCEEAKCSICGSVEVNEGYDKYCPNCGAEMESEDNDSN